MLTSNPLGWATSDGNFLNTTLFPIVQPLSICAPTGTGAERYHLPQIAAIGAHHPLSSPSLPSEDEYNAVSRGRPDGNADDHGRIVLECDLASSRSVGGRNPEIAVSSVVGKIDEFLAVGTN